MAESLPRKLAAVLHADVAGYSRLTGEDEEGTHQILRTYLPLIADQIEAHHGRVVHYAGDAVLAEFTTATDALSCAVDSQAQLAERNAELPENRRVCFRMGVNLGEVISDPPEIYGEGVNVAARLESLADVGGICVSETVRSTIGHLLPLEFEDMGEQEMKNIKRPVRVFRVRPHGTVTDAQPRARQAEEAATLAAAKPKLVVLPFETLGGGGDDDWFADGVTEDLTIELSRFRAVSVVAANTASGYRDAGTDLRAVAQTLGVEYIVQGSVRRAGDRVRVAVRLSDAEGAQLWAERFDRRLEDVFELQDEIVREIVAKLPARLEHARLQRVRRQPPSELPAYDLLVRARSHHHARTLEDNQRARALLEQALTLDPSYAQAHAWQACVLGQAIHRGYEEPTPELVDKMMTSAERSFALDQTDCECCRVAAEVAVLRGEHDAAVRHHQRAFELNPNDPRIIAQRGEMAIRQGRPLEAIPWLERAIVLDPQGAGGRYETLALAHQLAGDHQAALDAFAKSPGLTRFGLARHAWSLAAVGRGPDAEQAASRFNDKPGPPLDTMISWLHLQPEDGERLRQGLRATGVDV